MNIEHRIKEIIVEHLEVKPEDVFPEASLSEDLGGDSLDRIEIMMECEKTFGIKMTDEDAGQLRTVRDIIACLEEKMKPLKSGGPSGVQ